MICFLAFLIWQILAEFLIYCTMFQNISYFEYCEFACTGATPFYKFFILQLLPKINCFDLILDCIVLVTRLLVRYQLEEVVEDIQCNSSESHGVMRKCWNQLF